jgi:uncharacterized membrane protein YfcA
MTARMTGAEMLTSGLELAVALIGLTLGGFSKGALGVGLPLIAVPILALSMPVANTVAIMTAPIFLTNIYQALRGGMLPEVLRRYGTMGVGMVAGTAIGSQILITLDESTLYLIMGILVLSLPLARLLRINREISPASQRWLGPVFGLLGGVVGGISGFWGPIILVYLVALRMPKDLFAAAVGFLFSVASIAMSLFLTGHGVMDTEHFLSSLLACIPVFCGIYLGQRVRDRISQVQFERALSITMTVIGLSLLYRSVGS